MPTDLSLRQSWGRGKPALCGRTCYGHGWNYYWKSTYLPEPRDDLIDAIVGHAWRPGEDFGDRDPAWARRFFAALPRFREGVYVNFLGADENSDRVREAYGDSVYSRLSEVKSKYDPDNVFHHNQNIRPALPVH